MRKLIVIIVLCLCSVFTKAQDNYFYGAIKIPIADYIQYSLSKEGYDGSKMEGALFEIGYAINTDDYFVIELGLQAFFYSPFNKRYYQSGNQNYDELDVANKAFALQARPILRFDLGNEFYFRTAVALNVEKLYSDATFKRNSTMAGLYQASSRSSLNVSVQPLVGIEGWFGKSFGMGLDLVYINTNWSRSLQNLRFNTPFTVDVPRHRTSNMFLTGRIFFR